MMSRFLPKRVNIFLSIDRKMVGNYFNPHDTSSLYMRQLRFDFIQYLNGLLTACRKNSVICYKVSCKDEDEKLIKPFMHAVRRHFYMMERQKKLEFKKFKKRNFRLLIASTLIVILCHGLIPLIPLPDLGIYPALDNSFNVFSWVILWRPIDRLVFHWNPFLKEISLLHKMANAIVIRIKTNDVLFQSKDDLMNFQKSMIRA
jgi:hypothetical protein